MTASTKEAKIIQLLASKLAPISLKIVAILSLQKKISNLPRRPDSFSLNKIYQQRIEQRHEELKNLMAQLHQYFQSSHKNAKLVHTAYQQFLVKAHYAKNLSTKFTQIYIDQINILNTPSQAKEKIEKILASITLDEKNHYHLMILNFISKLHQMEKLIKTTTTL